MLSNPYITTRPVARAMTETRRGTLSLVAGLSAEDLDRTHSPIMSPLAWDLGHIAAYEDLWLVHRYGGRPLLRGDLMEIYDAFETPRAQRGEAPLLGSQAALDFLAEVRVRALEVLDERGAGDGLALEMVIRHEQQHGETMLQTMQLARFEPRWHTAPPAERDLSAARRSAGRLSGLEFVEVPAGRCTIGAPAGRFAYDNERPRHRTDVQGYLIGRAPITNATYLGFVEGGGYERREWWSHEGWAWKEEYDITRPGGWTAELDGEWRFNCFHPLDPERPVVHVSWFEADAFARAHGARLPTELEWEKAATWDQEHQRAMSYPWGEAAPRPGLHANVDRVACGPLPVSAHPAGASPPGCLAMIGDVWEWTANHFQGYPGFSAHPYREYSEVFFGPNYKVLRGGSFASGARALTSTFRNWDLPQRRQIFSGLRLARDL